MPAGSRACRPCPWPRPACPGRAPPAARARAAPARATGRRARSRARARAARPRAPPSRAGRAARPPRWRRTSSAWASVPSPSTTSGRPVRGRGHRGHQQARALVLLELADEEQEALGQRERRRVGARRPRASARVDDVRDHLHARDARRAQLARRWPRSRRGWRPRARSARRFRSEVGLHVRDGAPRRAAPGAARGPCTQRVMGRDAAAGQSAPRLMRVDQKQTGQWSRTVTATRPGAVRPGPPSAESECWAWTTASACAAPGARANARGTARRLRPRARQPPRRARPSRSSGPGLVVTHRHVVAGGAQAEGERARRPAGAARARRIDLAGQHDLHAAIRAQHAPRAARSGGPTSSARPRARARWRPGARAQRGVVGQAHERAARAAGSPSRDVQALLALAHDLGERRARDGHRGQAARPCTRRSSAATRRTRARAGAAARVS